MKNKNAFKFLTFLLAIFGLVLLASPFLLKDPTKNAAFADSGDAVTIANVDFNITVGEDGVLHVKEKFDVTFNRSSLSEVVVYIPYEGYIYRQEGEEVKRYQYLAKISNYSLTKGQSGTEELGFITTKWAPRVLLPLVLKTRRDIIRLAIRARIQLIMTIICTTRGPKVTARFILTL